MDEWTRLALAARDSGSEDDLAALVRATQGDVWRLCAHLGDLDRADDLAQEVYARALRSLRRYRGDAPARAWLFTIVRRVVADDIAERQRRRREPAVDVGSAPDHQAAVVLEQLLDALEPDRRTAFVLTQLLGWSYAEAAAACDCPVGTIRSRVARARETLAGLVADDGPRRAGSA
ncbi:sigma-70 family RNA polymerase sigma factor [Nocardioides sp. KR10-350]|uniref:sigma-70 family RNA polymerase sigma factor n=1 Tax=Nocardioides cheoyonin TaxID=3156615 RepID=UPI0032B3B224